MDNNVLEKALNRTYAETKVGKNNVPNFMTILQKMVSDINTHNSKCYY